MMTLLLLILVLGIVAWIIGQAPIPPFSEAVNVNARTVRRGGLSLVSHTEPSRSPSRVPDASPSGRW